MTEPTNLPMFPLGTVLYPGALLPLHVFEERYRRLMRDRRDDDPIFGVVLMKRGREVDDQPELHTVGTAASLVGARRAVDGRYDVVVRGGRRFRVLGGDWSRGYFVAAIEWMAEPSGDQAEAENLRDDVMEAYSSFLDSIVRPVGVEIPDEEFPWDPIELSYAIAARLPLDTWERQALLEAPSGTERLRDLLAVLRRERAFLLAGGQTSVALDHSGRRFSPN